MILYLITFIPRAEARGYSKLTPENQRFTHEIERLLLPSKLVYGTTLKALFKNHTDKTNREKRQKNKKT